MVFTVLGVLLLAVIIPTQIAYVKNAYPQPRFFPQYHRGTDDRAGIVLFASGLAQGGKPQSRRMRRPTLLARRRPAWSLTLGIVILYVIILHFIPYIPATMVSGSAHHSSMGSATS